MKSTARQCILWAFVGLGAAMGFIALTRYGYDFVIDAQERIFGAGFTPHYLAVIFLVGAILLSVGTQKRSTQE